MPTEPLASSPQPYDEKLERTKVLFKNDIRDTQPKWANRDVFPLDIRRCMRINRETGKPAETRPFKNPNDNIFFPPAEFNPESLRTMNPDDPWWVTEGQQVLRDVPPRRAPPRTTISENSDLLPLDDSQWREQVTLDGNYDARYFITNLHGGTLVVNGMEVKMGCVAGPLPAFAVIESPGGQVSFWFGVGGRNWREGSANLRFESHWEGHWETLRGKPGWENVGVMAEKVWDDVIRDRQWRERTGDDLEDDEMWKRWKKFSIEGPGSGDGVGAVTGRSVEKLDILAF